MAKKRVKVVSESDTGRNTRYRDNSTGKEMTRPELVRRIRQGEYENYHVRTVNGLPTPASNPDGKKNKNLG